MPHEYDTGLEVSQRTAVRRAVLERLEVLTRAEGGYLSALVALPAPIRSASDEEIAMLVEETKGRQPAIAVATGGKRFAPAGMTGPRDRYAATLDVHVYALSKNLRSAMARVEGDAVSAADLSRDPGIDTILEHAAALLIGFQPQGVGGTIHRLIPVEEDEFDTGGDYTLWRQRYEVLVEVEVLRNKGVTQLLTLIRSEFSPAGADAQNPVVTTETEP